MAENSIPSAKSAKRNTGKTGNLTPELALEILQEAVRRCELAGIQANVAPFYSSGQRSVVIVLADVELVDGNFVLANARKDQENA